MRTATITEPDITLLLDLNGTIREASVSRSLGSEVLKGWLDRPWKETVVEDGSDRIGRIVNEARETGISAFRQVVQRFPSGLEVPMEYTTVLLGGRAGLMVVGKSLQAIAELQSRLISAQQMMERDHWKLREIETKYRLLFDASQEPVVLLNSATLRIAEANPAAILEMGLESLRGNELLGRAFLPEVAAKDRDAFQSMLARVRENGKAAGIVIQLGKQEKPWIVRGSLMTAEPGPVMLLQFSPGWTGETPTVTAEPISVEEIMERLPDAFIVIDKNGFIRRTNRAFLDFVEVASKGSVIGEPLSRWLARAGADLSVLLANVARHGSIRLFSTTLQGELGSTTEVEISATGTAPTDADFMGVVLRDVGRRITVSNEDKSLRAELNSIAEHIGNKPLRKLVKDTVAVVERHYLTSALKLADSNRTVASELLGLSRQSFYAKLNRYGLAKDIDQDDEEKKQ